MLKPSQFNVMVNNYPIQGQNLLYNTFTRALVSVGNELALALESLPEIAGSADVLSALGKLKSQGIVIDAQLDEAQASRNLRDSLRHSSTSMRAVILTTYMCNFNCKYCVEGSSQEGIKRPTFMNPDTTKRTIYWLQSRVWHLGIKYLFLLFYGGEPLLHPDPMYTIAKHLADFSESHGITFGFGITTNGSL